jgi:hypothetical protein
LRRSPFWSAGACSRFSVIPDVELFAKNRDWKKSGGEPPHSKLGTHQAGEFARVVVEAGEYRR